MVPDIDRTEVIKSGRTQRMSSVLDTFKSIYSKPAMCNTHEHGGHELHRCLSL